MVTELEPTSKLMYPIFIWHRDVSFMNGHMEYSYGYFERRGISCEHIAVVLELLDGYP